MADTGAPTIGSAQVQITANLDRLETELARAQKLTNQFQTQASSGSAASTMAANNASRAYATFAASMQKAEQAVSAVSKAGTSHAAQLLDVKTKTDAASASYMRYTDALSKTDPALAAKRLQDLKEAANANTSSFTVLASKLGGVAQALTLVTATGQVTYGVVKTITLAFDAWQNATDQIATSVQLVADASEQHISVDVFQGLSKSATALKVDVNELFSAFQKLDEISKPGLGGSALQNRIDQLTLSGPLRNNTGLEAYKLASTNIDKFEAVSKLITEAYQKGQVLASFDLASKFLPADLMERFKAFPDLLDQIIAKEKQLTPKDTSATYYAAGIQNQFNDIDKRAAETSDKWAKAMAKPWLEQPWTISRYFQQIGEEFTHIGDVADASIKKFIFGITGARPAIRQVLYDFQSAAKQMAVDNPFEPDTSDPFALAAKRTKQGVVSPTRGGFPSDQQAQVRWTQEYADALAKVNVLVRDQTKVQADAAEAVETARRAYGDELDLLDPWVLALASAKQHILEMGGALATAEVQVDQSAGALARSRLEFALYDAAVKRFKAPELIPQKELDKISDLGKQLESAIKTKQAAADFGQITAALGTAANQTEVFAAKYLKLTQVMNSVHGRMTEEQKDRANEALTIETSNQFLTQRTALLGEATPVEDKMLETTNKLSIARLAGINLSAQEIETIKNNTREQLNGVRALQTQTDSITAQNATFNMTTGAATSYKLIQDELNKNFRSGKQVTDEDAAAFRAWAMAVGVATQAGSAQAKQLEFTNTLISNQIATQALTAKSPQQKGDIAAQQTALAITREALKAGMSQADVDKQVASAKKLAIDTEIAGLREAARQRDLGAKQTADSARVEIASIGASVGETYKLQQVEQTRQQLEQEAADHKIPMDNAQLKRLTDRITTTGNLKQAQAELAAADTANFDRQSMFLSDTEKQIATVQKSLHGNAWPQFMNDGLSATLRINAALKSISDGLGQIVSGTMTGFLDQWETLGSKIQAGKALLTSFISAAKQLSTSLVDASLKAFSAQAVGSLTSAVGGGGGATGAQIAGANTAATILTTAGTTVAAAFVAGATEAATILGITGSTTGAELAAGGVTAGTSVAAGATAGSASLVAGGVEGGAAVATGGTIAGAAMSLGIGLLIAALVAAASALLGSSDTSAADAKAAKDKADMDASNSRAADYRRRSQTAGLDTSTLTGQLTSFDLDAQRQREDEAKQAYSQMGELELALANERLAIVKKFRDQVMDTEKQFQADFVNDPLTQIASKMKDIADQGAALIDDLTQLGDSTADVSNQMTQAVDKLRGGFLEDLTRQLDSATGRDYINSIKDLVIAAGQQRSDAALLGADPTMIDKILAASVQKVIDDTGLVGDAFDEMMTQFPELAGIVHKATANIEQLGKTIDDYLNGLKFGQLSTLTQAQQFGAAQQQFAQQFQAAQGSGPDATAAQGNITQVADQFLTIARSFLGPSDQYKAIYDAVTQQLASLPGLVGGMAGGGVVGNGLYGIDSVRARYAGGGDIALAGGEFVMPANRVNSNTLPRLQSMRSGANDNDAVVSALNSAVNELRQSRADNRMLISGLMRVAAGGNQIASDIVKEIGGLRTDTRQGAAVADVRRRAS